MKRILTVFFIAAFIYGCASLRAGSPASGASAQAPAWSPFPKTTDQGKF